MTPEAGDMTGDRRSRAVQADYVSLTDLEDCAVRDWIRDRPRAYNLDDHRVVDEAASGIGWAEPKLEPLPEPSPDSHRSGTCFAVESTEMREACVDPLAAYLETDVTLHEVRHQRNGYHTDLVFADADPMAVRDRATMSVSWGPLHEPIQRFRVWWYLYENGPMPRSDAVEHGRYADLQTNRTHLDWLLDNGYVARTATNHVVGIRPPKLAELHAVELKLRDWETALEQADRANRNDVDERYIRCSSARGLDRWGYADYRWVALDAGAIDPALEHEGEFRDRGVGLLAIAEGGAVVEHIPAVHEPRERYTRDRAWAESEIWDRLDFDEWVAEPGTDDGNVGETGAQESLALFDGGERR